MANNADCCDDLPTSNVGKYTSRGRDNNLSSIFKFQELKNPIPAEVKDPEQFKKTFGPKAFIPYAGTNQYSSHSLLTWLNSMKFLSPTHGACQQSIKSYALGGLLDIVRIPSTSFDLGYGYGKEKADGSPDVAETTKKSFAEFLQENVSLGHHSGFKDLKASCFDELGDNGNCWLELTMTDINGVKKTSIHYHPAESVCYLATDPTKVKIAGISNNWGFDYIQDKPARQVPVYPAKRVSNGVTSTMIHVKNGNYTWYGRPSWMPAFMYTYREFQDSNYLIKQAANNFVGQVLIEVEDADAEHTSPFDNDNAQDAGFKNVAARVRENFTAQGENPQTVMLITRPFGASPAFVHQFKPNTNENFYKVNSDIAELKIIRAHQWSKRFLGENQTQGFSANVFVDELKVKEAGVLNNMRLKSAEAINIALKEIVKFYGLSEFNELGVLGKNNFETLKSFLTDDELGDFNKTATQESTDSLGSDKIQSTR